MDMIKSAIYGLCAASVLPFRISSTYIDPKGCSVPFPLPQHLADTTEMSLLMAQSIIACGKINPEDMMARLLQWEDRLDRSVRSGTAISAQLERYRNGVPAAACGQQSDAGSCADRMLPVAIYLYLVYGEHLLLYHGALDDIRAASVITHNSPEAIAESQLYCGILGKLLAGRKLQEAVIESVSILHRYYASRREYGSVLKVLRSVDAGTDIHLQPVQLDGSGTFRTTLDWATFLLNRSKSFVESVRYALDAPVFDQVSLSAATGTMAGLIYGFDAIPGDWVANLRGMERIARACDLLSRFWESTIREKGAGYGCTEEGRWKDD